MTPTATRTRGGRQARSRDDMIRVLRRYAEVYGPDFTAAAFSPSTAKWRDDLAAIDRYYLGDPETGAPWPSLNSIKAAFDGSFNAAREAAGLPVNRPGKRRRATGTAAPIRDVSHAGATRTIFVEKADDGTADKLRRDLARATARAERAEAKLATRPRAVGRPRTKPEKVIDEDMLARVRRRAEQATAKMEVRALEAERKLDDAKAKAREAQGAAIRAAAKQERAEATITTLRAEARTAGMELAAARDAAGRFERERDAARADRRVVVAKPPEQEEVDEARREAESAREAALRADARARKADDAYFEIAAATSGERRRLSADELKALKRSGPVGPGPLGDALKALARARSKGNGPALRAALAEVAAASVGWREAL